ncbi:MAG TPA: glycosyltransferase family A protein [Verrucomicrobiota bacterium]|nr:hypothetical protein [Verrucomicrobiales bacterium]HRI12730.1 glycosyltransferase family A protein [Verrucomicrobiota bacterium]
MNQNSDSPNLPSSQSDQAGPAKRLSIAIVIPCYNMARYLFRAVLSGLWQLEPQDELIVVDDASSDLDEYAGLRPFLDRLTWIRNPKNLGLPGSRNVAIRATEVDWIKFLDADDVLAPYALNVIRDPDDPIPPGVQVVAGGCHRVINNNYVDFLYSSDESMQSIMSRNPLLCSAVFARRSALLEVGLFDDRLDFEEDWDMWLRLNERYGLGAFAHTLAPFCYYWISDSDRREKHRTAMVEGMNVREYFRKRYGATPSD